MRQLGYLQISRRKVYNTTVPLWIEGKELKFRSYRENLVSFIRLASLYGLTSLKTSATSSSYYGIRLMIKIEVDRTSSFIKRLIKEGFLIETDIRKVERILRGIIVEKL